MLMPQMNDVASVVRRVSRRYVRWTDRGVGMRRPSLLAAPARARLRPPAPAAAHIVMTTLPPGVSGLDVADGLGGLRGRATVIAETGFGSA